ncbi:hypothetical protein [Stigmatella aurantiaca]|uniref:Conserved uncharacterized protein n=1 Tax=Stigmatella aurantiaca (strain DW4/3-1) TaxID=378806 RepID=Q093U3_STIAD|nr:hypothetical protein [Stigmatella aurantiaca]ADO69737.1 conserved uncharacterized protein [Stigmatella aurantiaca DW4/3-1]EAU67042.1 hypothetical protein STIAU_3537 [Stigmatella aurantiaca DW4/3-1]
MGTRGAVLGLVLLTGCRGVSLSPVAFDEAARVEALALSFQPDGTGLLTLRLTVHSPTAEASILTAVDFELVVEGQRLATGIQGVEVPMAQGGSTQTVEVRFPLVSDGPPGTAHPMARQVQLRGGVSLRYGVRTVRRAPFHEERLLPLPWVPLATPSRE